MLYKLLKIVLTSLSIIIVSYSQQHTIMTYNLLNYPGSTSAIRNPYFITVLSNTEPDIIVAQEMLSQAGVNQFVSDVLMQVSTDYVAGIFINGSDTDNAIFFKSSLFSFIANNPIHTALRDINEFVLIHNASGDTIRIYSLHLKASQGSTNELKRAAEVDSLRKVTDALHPGANFIIAGDFNIYYSNESAYQKLLNQTNSGYILDPIDSPGSWHNNPTFASIHTQSPRTRQFGGGANGGMDDRFDMILTSQSISDEGGITYVMDSYTAYGNDGMHFNDSINAPPNSAVGQEIADAIHYASDHIPLYAIFNFEDTPYIRVTSPNGGEVFCGGTNQNITWEDNLTGTMKIELYQGGQDPGDLHSILTSSTPSDGEYIWSFPGGMNPSPGYQIKISSNDDNNIFDFSDSTFTIGCNITLVSPNGGEEWCAETTETINWTQNFVGNIEIQLFKAGVFNSSITPSTVGDGEFDFIIPAGALSSDLKIKIVSVDDGNISDISDSSFYIIACDRTIISPNGGEIWMQGSTENISWTSENVISVKIELSINNGTSWSTITDSTASTGIYSWLVNASQTSNQALIRISDLTNGNILDQSYDVFTIDIAPAVDEEFSGIPESYKLLQNYPNPFNPSTTIYYGLPVEASVKITIYDVLGNEVMVYSEDNQEAGYHSVEFNATVLPSGIYFYQLRAGSFVETKKMILLK